MWKNMFKKGGVKSRIYIYKAYLRSTLKIWIQRETYKYWDLEKSRDIEHKNEKEKLKREYSRLRLVLRTELVQKINTKNKNK
jgi:hypothetical protein